jgi:hypothetical protein
MSTQPRALRLADELDAVPETGADPQLIADSAAELRLLHAELQRCKQVCAATSECWRADAESWKAERDALAEPVVNQHLTTEPVQEPGDFNSLNPRDCWMKGYMTGVRAALDWEEYLKKLGELR